MSQPIDPAAPTPADRAAIGQNCSPLVTTEPDASPSLPPSAPDDGLTPQQRLAVAAILCGATMSSAAARANVSRNTLYNWRKQPAFARVLNELSRDALEAAATRARNLMLKATHTLAASLDGRDRFEWAVRVVNSRRLWDAGRSLPAAESADEEAK